MHLTFGRVVLFHFKLLEVDKFFKYFTAVTLTKSLQVIIVHETANSNMSECQELIKNNCLVN